MPSYRTSQLQQQVSDHQASALHDLQNILYLAAAKCEEEKHEQRANKPWKSSFLHTLICLRRESHDPEERRKLSKQIWKESRRALRKYRAELSQCLLEKFSDLKQLDSFRHAPIHKRVIAEIPSDDFANFLGQIYHSNHESLIWDPVLIAQIPKFSMSELRNAVKSMSNNKAADKHGIVIEMIKYADEDFY